MELPLDVELSDLEPTSQLPSDVELPSDVDDSDDVLEPMSSLMSLPTTFQAVASRASGAQHGIKRRKKACPKRIEGPARHALPLPNISLDDATLLEVPPQAL